MIHGAVETMAMAMDLDNSAQTPTGRIVIQKVAGRSAATSLFARYPLKFIRPTKVVSSQVDVVWIYTVSFGGGIVTGDLVYYTIAVGEGCTAVLATQASTKTKVGTHTEAHNGKNKGEKFRVVWRSIAELKPSC